jgi:hypothetical protein
MATPSELATGDAIARSPTIISKIDRKIDDLETILAASFTIALIVSSPTHVAASLETRKYMVDLEPKGCDWQNLQQGSTANRKRGQCGHK